VLRWISWRDESSRGISYVQYKEPTASTSNGKARISEQKGSKSNLCESFAERADVVVISADFGTVSS
jgi:hypothetical protein